MGSFNFGDGRVELGWGDIVAAGKFLGVDKAVSVAGKGIVNAAGEFGTKVLDAADYVLPGFKINAQAFAEFLGKAGGKITGSVDAVLEMMKNKLYGKDALFTKFTDRLLDITGKTVGVGTAAVLDIPANLFEDLNLMSHETRMAILKYISENLDYATQLAIRKAVSTGVLVGTALADKVQQKATNYVFKKAEKLAKMAKEGAEIVIDEVQDGVQNGFERLMETINAAQEDNIFSLESEIFIPEIGISTQEELAQIRQSLVGKETFGTSFGSSSLFGLSTPEVSIGLFSGVKLDFSSELSTDEAREKLELALKAQ